MTAREESYTVLARRYRPVGFDEVVGQEHVATTLKNAIKEGRIGHAYLFAGPRGVGKTSTARLLAKAINCVKGPTEKPCNACELCTRIQEGTDTDVIEMDAASNRGVDDARSLRDGVRYAPLRARYKIYIIDEAHMLTREAFNTLLKTLEEPPPHVKFIFATTELHKLPDTVISRCQQFDFRRITSADIVRRLKQVVAGEKIKVDDVVLASIARAGRGSMRDAESILDQLLAFKQKDLTAEDVTSLLGAASGERLDTLVAALGASDAGAVLTALDSIFETGVDTAAFADQLLDHLRTLLVLKACGKASRVVDLPDALLAVADRQAAGFSQEALLYFLQMILEARHRIKEGGNPRIILEVSLVKMAKAGDLIPLAEAMKFAKTGAPMPSAPAPVPKVAPPVDVDRPPAEALADAPDESEPEPIDGELSVQVLQENWTRFITEVQLPLVKGMLGSTKPTKLSGNEVEITFQPGMKEFHVKQLDIPKHRANIEAALHHVFGRKLSFHAVLPKGGAPAPDAPKRSSGTPDLTSDPAVRKVLDAFPGSKIIGIE